MKGKKWQIIKKYAESSRKKSLLKEKWMEEFIRKIYKKQQMKEIS